MSHAIQRYDVADGAYWREGEGYFIKYSDHLAAIAALEERVRGLEGALVNCREDSVQLLSEWSWKEGERAGNAKEYNQVKQHIADADAALAARGGK